MCPLFSYPRNCWWVIFFLALSLFDHQAVQAKTDSRPNQEERLWQELHTSQKAMRGISMENLVDADKEENKENENEKENEFFMEDIPEWKLGKNERGDVDGEVSDETNVPPTLPLTDEVAVQFSATEKLNKEKKEKGKNGKEEDEEIPLDIDLNQFERPQPSSLSPLTHLKKRLR